MQTQHEDRDREQEMAEGVRVAHEKLVEAYRDTPKGAVEDAAREILAQDEQLGYKILPEDQRRELVWALTLYQNAVNDLWVYAEQAGITRSLVSNWTRRNKRNLAQVPREEYDCEGTFGMRFAVCAYRAGQASLRTFAQKFVDVRLDEYRGQVLSAYALPGREARVTRASNRGELPEDDDLGSDE